MSSDVIPTGFGVLFIIGGIVMSLIILIVSIEKIKIVKILSKFKEDNRELIEICEE